MLVHPEKKGECGAYDALRMEMSCRLTESGTLHSLQLRAVIVGQWQDFQSLYFLFQEEVSNQPFPVM